MGERTGFWYKFRLLTNLSTLVLISIITSVGRGFRNFALRPLGYLARRRRADTGLLVSTYELMREQLRDSLKEIEKKNQQLEETSEKLRKSRDFLQSIIDSLGEELMVVDSEFCITEANRNFKLKHENKEILGRHCYQVMYGLNSPCSPPLRVCPVKQVWQTGMPARVLQLHNGNGDSTGEDRYFEVSVSPVYDRNGEISRVVELARDVTQSTELEKKILEVNSHLLLMNAIATTASQSLSLDVILNGVLDKALELMGTEAGGILLVDEKSQGPYYRALRGLSEQSEKGIAGLRLARLVAERGETLALDRIDSESTDGMGALISVPLKSKERVVGVLNIASETPRTFSQQEVQLLTSLGHQLGIAVENAQLYRELQIKEQMRTELLRRIISAQEDERQRVARELHDVTSQALATLGVGLEALTTAPQSNPGEREAQLEGIRSLLAATSKDVHRLIYALRPSLIDDLGLSAALRSCAHNSLDAAGVEVHLEVAGQERKLPAEVEIALFRIVQEAIVNIARHAHAESAYVSLEFKDNGVSVQIEDDGIGFDYSPSLRADSGGRGVGLLGMQERAELLGGTLTIDTKPGAGTRIFIHIPVKSEDNDV